MEQAPDYMEKHWLEVKEIAERQIVVANRELGKIAAKKMIEINYEKEQ